MYPINNVRCFVEGMAVMMNCCAFVRLLASLVALGFALRRYAYADGLIFSLMCIYCVARALMAVYKNGNRILCRGLVPTVKLDKLWKPPNVLGKLTILEALVVNCHGIYSTAFNWPFSPLRLLFKPLTTTARFDSIVVQNNKSTCADLRPNFRVNDLPIIPASRHHTHPKAASERTAASNTINEIVRKAGFEPYFVSMASADQRDGFRGVRHFYWSKDIKADYRMDSVGDADALVFIDVDFHCPMDDYLAKGQPVMMYTLVPDDAAYRGKEHCYKIKDNVVEYTVSGSAKYVHGIWDYDHEIISVDDGRWWKPRLWTNVYYFNVEQRIVDGEMGSSRRIIALLPFAKLPLKHAHLIPATPLQRKQFTFDGVNRVYNSVTDKLSLALNDSLVSVTTTGRSYSALVARANAKEKGVLTVGDVEQYLYTPDKAPVDVKHESAILHSILTVSRDVQLVANVIPTSVCHTTFTPLNMKQQLFEVESACQILTTPLVASPALFPGKNRASDQASIMGRVEKLYNNKRPHTRFAGYAREFVNRIVPHGGCGIPWSIAQIEEVQNRPLQRARLLKTIEHIGIFSRNKLQTFVKGEAYPSTNDPRVITTVDPKCTVELSQFTYAFKNDILKKYEWYGPGKTPRESAERVKSLSQYGTTVTDFTRFDGTISEWLQRNVVFAAYMRWVRVDHRPHLEHHLNQTFVSTGRTKLGYKYNAGWGTRSGSPLTTDGNTMINAFIGYSAFREIGYGEERAMLCLGIYAGDDGLNAVFSNYSTSIENVCMELGLNVKLELTAVGSPTSYLGRIFPKPNTSINSFQDMKRTLPRLHVTANRGIDRRLAAVNKCTGYLVTDPLTPILSDYCRAVLNICKDLVPACMLSEEVYKIECGAWPQDDEDEIFDGVCQQLGMDSVEILEAQHIIGNVKSLEDFPVIWNNCYDHKLDAITENGLVTRARIGDIRENATQRGSLGILGKSGGAREPTSGRDKIVESDDSSSGVSSGSASSRNGRAVAKPSDQGGQKSRQRNFGGRKGNFRSRDETVSRRSAAVM